MKIKIMSDSTCDLGPELLKKNDIVKTPICPSGSVLLG